MYINKPAYAQDGATQYFSRKLDVQLALQMLTLDFIFIKGDNHLQFLCTF